MEIQQFPGLTSDGKTSEWFSPLSLGVVIKLRLQLSRGSAMTTYHEKCDYSPTEIGRCLAAIKRTESASDGRHGSASHRLMKHVNLERHKFHGDWNYNIRPQSK
jgi:hypothetical protein